MMTLQQLRELAAQVGFPNPSLAAAIAMAESSGNPLAVGDGGTSFGLWQIHVPDHPEYHASSLGDPLYNAQAAYAISRGGSNWSPWSTFNKGPHGEPPAYLHYMGAA